MNYKKVVFLSDTHIPFIHKKANSSILKFLKDFKPNVIGLGGDIIDLWQCSKFLKDPRRKENIQEDFDLTKAYLTELRDTCPRAEFFYLAGNHEDRLRKYIYQHSQSIASLKSLSLEFQLDIENLKINFFPKSTAFYQIGGISYKITYKKMRGNSIGLCKEKELTITIHYPSPHWKNSLLHEIIHGIEIFMNLEFSEDHVNAIANGLIMVFNDNPELLEILKDDYPT